MSAINDLINQIENEELRDRIQAEVDKLAKQKKFGLVFEEHLPECTPLYDIPVRRGAKVALKQGEVNDFYEVLAIDGDQAVCLKKGEREAVKINTEELVTIAEFGEPIYPCLKPIDTVCNAPDSDLWHTLIEADNYYALQLLEYLYAGKVDCIYIDPPYNTGAKDWKYNNDYVDSNDSYRHSKWLSMMQKRLRIAKKLLNPQDSVLIVTIDEKEYLHLGCLLEEMFPNARIQMVTSIINRKGVSHKGNRSVTIKKEITQFSRVEEYLFFVMLGEASIRKAKCNMLDKQAEGSNAESVISDKVSWLSMLRRGSASHRADKPKHFYPIFVNRATSTIVDVGLPLDVEEDRNSVKARDGIDIIWPMRTDGSEGRWQLKRESFITALKNGTAKLGSYNKSQNRWAINYLNQGIKDEIEKGAIIILGKDDKGALVLKRVNEKEVEPKSVWNQTSHNASEYGTTLLNNIIGSNRFSYPKSLYAVKDTVLMCVADKKNALIVDFFAGSGTTLHAVNLLNAEDGGNRRCILVTNNEVSADEAEMLTSQGYHPGDEEWEKFGIARYVTWPRTVCSIIGKDINGNPITGDYGIIEEEFVLDDEDTIVSKKTGKPVKKNIYVKQKVQKNQKLESIKKADGFKVNAAYFKLGFLDKNSVALGRQFKEMLPTLWMKAGAIGRCPELHDDDIQNVMIYPENKFAVLTEETAFSELLSALSQYSEIETVYIITDYEPGYRSMAKNLNVKQTYQLYRDYLDNFRINIARD